MSENKKKLYDVLHERKLYTKSFEEFEAKYSDEEAQKKLFDVISERKLYTKGFEEFVDQYEFTKKKELSELSSEPASTDISTDLSFGEEASESLDRSTDSPRALTDQELIKEKTPFERDTDNIQAVVLDKYSGKLKAEIAAIQEKYQAAALAEATQLDSIATAGGISQEEYQAKIDELNNRTSEQFNSEAKALTQASTDLAQKEALDTLGKYIDLNKEKVKAFGPSEMESMVSNFVQPLYKLPGQALQLVGAASTFGDVENDKIFETLGVSEEVGFNGFYDMGKKYVDFIEEMAPTNPAYAEDLKQQFSGGLGQVASMLITAGATGMVGKTASLAGASRGSVLKEASKKFVKTLTQPTAAVGGIQMSIPEFEQALEAGATPGERMEVLAANFIGGSVLEQAPMLQFLKRLDNATASTFSDWVAKKGAAALKGGLEEGFTEFLQGVYSNATAKEVYDSSREILDGVYQEGYLGFGIGALLNAMGANVRIAKNKDKDSEYLKKAEDLINEYESNNNQQSVSEGATAEGVQVGAEAESSNEDVRGEIDPSRRSSESTTRSDNQNGPGGELQSPVDSDQVDETIGARIIRKEIDELQGREEIDAEARAQGAQVMSVDDSKEAFKGSKKGLKNFVKATQNFKSKDGNALKVVVATDQNQFSNLTQKIATKEEQANAGEVAGFYDDRTHTIVLNNELMEDNTAAHEFLHPVLNSYLRANPDKLTALANEALKDKEIQEFASQYEEGSQRNREAVIESLSRAVSGELENKSFAQKVKDFFREIMTAIGIDSSVVVRGDDLANMATQLSKALTSGRAIDPSYLKGEKYQVGVTTFRTPETFSEEEFESTRVDIEKSIAALDGIIESRVSRSVGEYFSQSGEVIREPSYDIDFTVKEGADVSQIRNKIHEVADKYDQESSFISKVTDSTNENARPMIEIGLRTPSKDSPIIDEIKQFLVDNNVRGFSTSKDSEGNILGIRSQFIPEFENTSTEEGLDRFGTSLQELFEKYNNHPELSYISGGFVDTEVRFKEQKNEQDGQKDDGSGVVQKDPEGANTEPGSILRGNNAEEGFYPQKIKKSAQSASDTDSVARKSAFIVENIEFFGKEFMSRLQENGVTEVQRKRISQLITFVKNKGAIGKITDSKIVAMDELIQSILKDDKLKKSIQAIDTIKRFINKGKLGEYFSNVEFITTVNPLLLSEENFDKFYNTVIEVATKLKRGNIFSTQIFKVMDLHDAIFTQFAGKEKDINFYAGVVASMGVDPSLEQILDELNTLYDAPTQEDAAFIADNLNEIIETSHSLSGKTTKGEEVSIDPGMIMPYVRLAQEAVEQNPDQDLVDEADTEESLNDRVEQYILNNHSQFGDKAISEQEVKDNIKYLTKKGRYYSRRGDLIGTIESYSKGLDSSKFQGREKEYLDTIISLTSKDIENMENFELNNVLKILKGTMQGLFIPPMAQGLARKIKGIRRAKKLFGDVANKRFKPVFDATNQIVPTFEREIKTAIKAREKDPTLTSEKVRKKFLANTTANLSYIGKQMNKEFDNFVKEYDRFLEDYKFKTSEFNKKLNSKFMAIKSSFKFGGEHYNRGDVNIMSYMYLIERQFFSNLDSKKVPRLKELIAAKRKSAGKNEINQRIVELFEKFSEGDHLDLAKVRKFLTHANALNEAGSESDMAFVNYLQNKFRENQRLAAHNAKYTHKEPAEIFNSYVPLAVEKDMGKAPENFMESLGSMFNPALSAKTSISRQDYKTRSGYKETDLSFDLFSVSRWGVSDQYKDYYIGEAFRDAHATLTIAKSLGNKQSGAILDGLQSGLKEWVVNEVSSSYREIGAIGKIYETISRNIKTSILATTRRIGEIPSNMMLLLTHPNLAFVPSEMSTDELKELVGHIGSAQVQRINRQGLSAYSGEQRNVEVSEITKALNNPTLSKGANLMLTALEKASTLSSTYIGGTAEKLITLPDALVAINPLKNMFTHKFKELTGLDFQMNFVRDEELRSKYASELKEAMNAADRLVTNKFAGSGFTSTARFADSKNPIVRDILGFFASFRSIMTDNNMNALNSIFNLKRDEYYKDGSGSMSRGEAVTTLATNIAANTMYQIAATFVIHGVVDAIIDHVMGEDDDKPMEDRMKDAAKFGLLESLLMLTPFGKANSLIYATAAFLQKFLYNVSIEDRDPKKEIKSLARTDNFMRSFGGNVGLFATNTTNFAEFGVDPTTNNAIDVSKSVWLFSGIPFYSESNEILNRFKEKPIKKKEYKIESEFKLPELKASDFDVDI